MSLYLLSVLILVTYTMAMPAKVCFELFIYIIYIYNLFIIYKFNKTYFLKNFSYADVPDLDHYM